MVLLAQGRLKLRGTLVHPRGCRYISLNFAPKGAIACEVSD
jgi:hypothetical protein